MSRICLTCRSTRTFRVFPIRASWQICPVSSQLCLYHPPVYLFPGLPPLSLLNHCSFLQAAPRPDQGRRVGSGCGWAGPAAVHPGTALPSAEPMVLAGPPPCPAPPRPVLWALPFVYAAPARPLKLPLMFQRNELVSHHESGFEMREKSPGEAILGNWGHSHLQSGGSEPRNAGKFIPRQEPRRD